jgi:hypothetical protein
MPSPTSAKKVRLGGWVNQSSRANVVILETAAELEPRASLDQPSRLRPHNSHRRLTTHISELTLSDIAPDIIALT